VVISSPHRLPPGDIALLKGCLIYVAEKWMRKPVGAVASLFMRYPRMLTQVGKFLHRYGALRPLSAAEVLLAYDISGSAPAHPRGSIRTIQLHSQSGKESKTVAPLGLVESDGPLALLALRNGACLKLGMPIRTGTGQQKARYGNRRRWRRQSGGSPWATIRPHRRGSPSSQSLLPEGDFRSPEPKLNLLLTPRTGFQHYCGDEWRGGCGLMPPEVAALVVGFGAEW
jgi:hypothetical protein